MAVSSLDRINGFSPPCLTHFLFILLDYCLMCEIMHLNMPAKGDAFGVVTAVQQEVLFVEVMTMAIQIVLLGDLASVWSFLLWALSS